MTDIVVVGAGHAGLLAACAMAKLGYAVRLVDRATPDAIMAAGADGRTLALLAGSGRVAQRFGVWPYLLPYCAPVWRTEVTDAVSGRGVTYDGAVEDGAFGYGFENHALRRGLLEAFLAIVGGDGFVQGEIAAWQRHGDGATLDLADGRRLRSRLVVAADGRGSRLRALAGIRTSSWTYRQTAITLVLDHARAHGNAVREWLRPAGPLALLPLPGDRSGVTWVERPEAARELVAGGPLPLLRTLAGLTGGALGELSLASGPALYPLSALHARRYVAPRLALVGDAAHGAHPIHAQGFNMGVADIDALATALANASARGLDPGSGDALLAYARRRRPENDRRLFMTDTLNGLFSNDLAPLAQLRGLALSALDGIPPLKRAVLRHGMQLD